MVIDDFGHEQIISQGTFQQGRIGCKQLTPSVYLSGDPVRCAQAYLKSAMSCSCSLSTCSCRTDPQGVETGCSSREIEQGIFWNSILFLASSLNLIPVASLAERPRTKFTSVAEHNPVLALYSTHHRVRSTVAEGKYTTSTGSLDSCMHKYIR